MGDWEQATEMELLLQRLSSERTEPRGRRFHHATSPFDAQSQAFHPSQIYQDPDTHDDDLDEHDRALLDEPYPDRAFEAAQGRGRLSLPSAGQMSFSDNARSSPQNGPSQFDDALRHQQLVRAAPLANQTQRVRRPLQPISATRTPVRTIETQSSSPFFTQSSPTPIRPRRQEATQRPRQNLSSPQSQTAQATQQPQRGSSARALQRPRIAPPEDVENYPPPRPMPPPFSQPVNRAHVPAVPQTRMQGPTAQGIPLIPVCELPDSFATVFPYALFNAVQSKCYHQLIDTDDNFVMSAPTGSGKTVILELAIARLILTSRPEQFKVVYMAPTKALCSEKYRDWSEKFIGHDLKCFELTGDTATHDAVHSMQTANIIITTPEKWDSTTRKWKEHKDFMALVKALLIDEVHMLKDIRGATLEAVVARMRIIGAGVRFVALSATVPNAGDVAQWLGRTPYETDIGAHMETFGDEFRPVKLDKHVYGYGQPSGDNDFQLDEICSRDLPNKLSKHGRGLPILVFCSTRVSCIKTAKFLAEQRASDRRAQHWWSVPRQPLASTDPELQSTLVQGVAFHHAGVSTDERLRIEAGFANGEISVICCTSTLAVGVNTPCHLVIIKGTKGYSDAGLREYSDLDMMQMMGRAGRPQYGHQGAVAVIMTSTQNVKKYNRLASGKEPLESCLHINLIEHLNAEISLGTVTNLETAKRWLERSFLFIRLKKNAINYKFDNENAQEAGDVDRRITGICKRDLAALTSTKLVTDDGALSPTEFGAAMTRYCVRFKTMKLFLNLPERAKMSDVLSSLAAAEEFKEIKLQRGDGFLYKNLNTLPGIRFPLDAVNNNSDKCSLVVQAELGGVELPGNTSKAMRMRHGHAKMAIFKDIHRLVRCIVDCKISSSDAEAVRHALALARSLSAHAWDDWPEQLKQIESVGPVRVCKLVALGIKSISDLAEAEPARINMKFNSNVYGENWVAAARLFPRPTITISRASAPYIDHNGTPTVEVKVEIGFLNDRSPITFQRKPVFVCVMIERSDGHLLEFFKLKSQRTMDPILAKAHLTAHGQKIICRVMCDDFAGTSQVAELHPDVPQELFPRDGAQAEKTTMNESKKLSRKRSIPQSSRLKAITSDAFDDIGDLDDADLLAAEEQTGFRRLEDVVDLGTNVVKPNSAQQPKKDPEPRRRPDGRFECNHQCKDKTSCKHDCCKKGLEKPPKAPKPSKKDQCSEDNPKLRKLHQSTIDKSKFKPKAMEDAADMIESDESPDLPAEPRPSKRQKVMVATAASSRENHDEIVDARRRVDEELGVRSFFKPQKGGPFSVTANDPIDEFDEIEFLPEPDALLGGTVSASSQDKSVFELQARGTKEAFSLTATDPIDEFDEVAMLPEPNAGLDGTLPALPISARAFGMQFSSETSNDVYGHKEFSMDGVGPVSEADGDFPATRTDRTIPPMPTTDDVAYNIDDNGNSEEWFLEALPEEPFGSLRPAFSGREDLEDLEAGMEIDTGTSASSNHTTTILDDAKPQANAMEVSWTGRGGIPMQQLRHMEGIDPEICEEFGDIVDVVEDD